MSPLFEALAHLFHPRSSNRHHPRVLHPEAYAFYAIVLVWVAVMVQWLPAVSPQFQSVLGFNSSITVDEVVTQTNRVRSQQGLEELQYNSTLSEAAARKAADMFSKQYWAHVSPEGKQPWSFMVEAGYQYRVAGENLARDFSNTPDMIQAWLNSPTHRANVMNAKYTEIGIAVVPGRLNGYETTLVVQMFGSPKSQPLQVTQQGDTLIGTEAPVPSAVPVTVFEDNDGEQPQSIFATQPNTVIGGPAVLAGAQLPAGTVRMAPVFSPKLIIEIVGAALVLLLVGTLCYDWLWLSQKNQPGRLVGQNVAHIMYLATIALLIALYREGMVF